MGARGRAQGVGRGPRCAGDRKARSGTSWSARANRPSRGGGGGGGGGRTEPLTVLDGRGRPPGDSPRTGAPGAWDWGDRPGARAALRTAVSNARGAARRVRCALPWPRRMIPSAVPGCRPRARPRWVRRPRSTIDGARATGRLNRIGGTGGRHRPVGRDPRRWGWTARSGRGRTPPCSEPSALCPSRAQLRGSRPSRGRTFASTPWQCGPTLQGVRAFAAWARRSSPGGWDAGEVRRTGGRGHTACGPAPNPTASTPSLAVSTPPVSGWERGGWVRQRMAAPPAARGQAAHRAPIGLTRSPNGRRGDPNGEFGSDGPQSPWLAFLPLLRPAEVDR